MTDDSSNNIPESILSKIDENKYLRLSKENLKNFAYRLLANRNDGPRLVRKIYSFSQKINWNADKSFIDNFLKSHPCIYTKLSLETSHLLRIINQEESTHKYVNVIEEDWQNLIVLDACRFDLFKESHTFESGKLSCVCSPGSNTQEWIPKCIKKPHKDVVLVASNAFLSPLMLKKFTGIQNPFFHNEPVWDYGWNDDLKSITPEKTTKAARKMIYKYPGKRLMAWYIQPHHPFIGEKKMYRPWWKLKHNQTTIQEAWDAYKSNLKLVCDNIKEELLPYLNGKTIITSDHGNAMGEMYIYDHPKTLHIPPLINVPYYEIQK